MFLLSLTLFGALNAQVIDDFDETPGSKVKAAKVAYITERLGLTPDEAGEFWALYNQYEGEQERIRQKYRPSRQLDSMSDQEADAFIHKRFQMEQELLNLKKTYYDKFKSVISPRKIALFAKAEREFRQSLLQKLRNQQKKRQNRFGNN